VSGYSCPHIFVHQDLRTRTGPSTRSPDLSAASIVVASVGNHDVHVPSPSGPVKMPRFRKSINRARTAARSRRRTCATSESVRSGRSIRTSRSRLIVVSMLRERSSIDPLAANRLLASGHARRSTGALEDPSIGPMHRIDGIDCSVMRSNAPSRCAPQHVPFPPSSSEPLRRTRKLVLRRRPDGMEVEHALRAGLTADSGAARPHVSGPNRRSGCART
jgi:hypothetical protein